MKHLFKIFKSEERKLKKKLAASSEKRRLVKNYLLSEAYKKSNEWTVRERVNIRIPKWILNKAMLKALDIGGLGRYVEDLIIKDMDLEETERELNGKE